ncbi:DUF4365 domain-containing protein [Sphaerisporangium sp. TRM90804]|uniref:DUF4365 domain-containing protein n=1 Tax=Sphaerisporangium sp. TRM90804 TaxID=3031113 RepID=UPI002447EBAB|nr:DUF4365 domain-containing protein [Sphaerisporangium sp. TRM90804]MDH2429274.1 DUF4365 domain-containing protein [Sphaerisporangium sp. TRM90804]
MHRPEEHHTSRQGVSYCQQVFDDQYRWLFREQPISDFGIDAHVEIVDENWSDLVTGKLFALQIKSGSSYFRERCGDGWILRPTEDHVYYWASYSLPVVMVIYDPISRQGYWQMAHAESPALAPTERGGWKLWVPERNNLATEWSRNALLQIVSVSGWHIYYLPDARPWNEQKLLEVSVCFGRSIPMWRREPFWRNKGEVVAEWPPRDAEA